MIRSEAEELIIALEEWLDLRCDLKRFQARTPERERAFLLSEAARERLIDRLAGEDRTEPLAGRLGS